MRVSSTGASLDPHQTASRTCHEFGASQAYVWPRIKRYFHKLDRLMTAIAFAEAGNLDEVQRMLDENRAMNKLESGTIGNSRMARR